MKLNGSSAPVAAPADAGSDFEDDESWFFLSFFLRRLEDVENDAIDDGIAVRGAN